MHLVCTSGAYCLVKYLEGFKKNKTLWYTIENIFVVAYCTLIETTAVMQHYP